MMDDDMEPPMAKRAGPEDVPPVTVADTRYEVIHWGRERGLNQNGGYIAAIDANTNQELWTLEIYQVDYDDSMEEDVQDLFIQSMALNDEKTHLSIEDENGKRYTVSLKEKKVSE